MGETGIDVQAVKKDLEHLPKNITSTMCAAQDIIANLEAENKRLKEMLDRIEGEIERMIFCEDACIENWCGDSGVKRLAICRRNLLRQLQRNIKELKGGE